MATLAQLETALRNADKAGDMDAARKLAAVVGRARQDMSNQIPEAQVGETMPQAPESSFADQAIGAGEAALSVGTGLTGGTIGMIGGTLKGLAEQILSGNFGTQDAARLVEQSAMKGAQALTYAPRTQAGQELTQQVGEAMQQAIPALPLTAELGAVGAGMKAATPAVVAGAERAAAPVVQAAKRGVQSMADLIPGVEKQPTPGTMASGGAAAVDMATLRQARAEDLPVPMNLTEGMKTRDTKQQNFEREIAKNQELGAPIRERFADLNEQMTQNIESFIDRTGSEIPSRRGVGELTVKVLRDRLARDKAKERALYQEADKAGELEAPVSLAPLADYLNANRSGRTSAPIMKTIADELEVQNVGGGSLDDGSVMAGNATLRQAENIRKTVNRFVKDNDPTDIRAGVDIKKVIDSITKDAGGDLYRKARAAREVRANHYENVGLIDNLINTKRGSNDRVIALEDVVNKSILSPSTSLDTVRHLRNMLHTAAKKGTPEHAEGMQAWSELQGATLRHIRDEALKNVTTNERGHRIINPKALDSVINNLDKSEKLQFVFGKKGAEQLRTINDIAKDVYTSPPNAAINSSNTAATILAAMDMAISGTAGVPAPILSSIRLIGKGVKDAKTKARVKRALGTN